MKFMNALTYKNFSCALLSGFFFGSTAMQAADVTVYDSIVTLATNGTKNYTFTDASSGQSVTVALTMTPFSTDPLATLVALDGNTRAAVGNTNVGGDGNLVAYGEGVNLAASLASTSSGVLASSVKFRLQGFGLRAVDGNSPLYWLSSATASNVFALSGETVKSLDTTFVFLNSGSYTGKLGFAYNDGSDFQLSDAGTIGGLGLGLNATFTVTNLTDPRTNSWLTTYAGKYARIYTTDANKTAGTSATTWNNGTQNQSNAAYCGIQEVYSSSNYVYIRSTGLGAHIMGPWYLNAAHTTTFPNYPVNQRALFRIPRTVTIPTTKTQTGLGTIGFFVDGVAMFDSADGFVWTGSAEAGNGTGYWHREAYANEGVTFDPGYAHQENTGNHHYHANPIALRYLLGDHVSYNSTTKIYSESTNAVTPHSPILGWVKAGLPIYGPYGYSNATNASSGVRRMISGFQLRNGLNGTDNLTNTARATIPAWATRLYSVAAAQAGPAVSSTYPIARYMEDYAYLGDLVNTNTGLTNVLGVDFDLNEYNVRYCVTPEFPGGTYAYWVSMETNGTPKYPNNIGRAFYGSPVGSNVTSITDTVITNFLGNTNLTTDKLTGFNVSNSVVTLAWRAVEGGYYSVQASTNLITWTNLATNVQPTVTTGGYTNTSTLPQRFYRVARTGAATFDSAGTTTFSSGGGTGSFTAPGGSVSRGTGTNISLTITLPTTPPNPPTNAPITSVTLGSLTATSSSYATAGTVIANFMILSNTPTGAQNVVVTFNMPVFTLTNGFTINP